MKKILVALGLVTIVLFLVSFFIYKSEPYLSVSGFTQGTTYHVKVLKKLSLIDVFSDKEKELKRLVEEGLSAFDSSLNAYVNYSVISKINRNDTLVSLDSYFVSCFTAAKLVYEETEGIFDITGGPLYNAWGFGPGKKAEVPESVIDSVLMFVGMDKVKIENKHFVKSDPRIQLNVNAIAQGYSVDVIGNLLKMAGYTNFIVEIGGEIYALGRKRKNGFWQVGLDKPLEGNNTPGENLQLVLSLENKSLATSGNYRKYFVQDGIKYAHSIDPVSGYPIKHNLLSVTVLADECIFAYAYATAFMVKGLEWSKNFVEQKAGLDACFIYSDEQGGMKSLYSSGFEKATRINEIK